MPGSSRCNLCDSFQFGHIFLLRSVSSQCCSICSFPICLKSDQKSECWRAFLLPSSPLLIGLGGGGSVSNDCCKVSQVRPSVPLHLPDLALAPKLMRYWLPGSEGAAGAMLGLRLATLPTTRLPVAQLSPKCNLIVVGTSTNIPHK